MNLLQEIRRRKVGRVAVAYGITAWLVVQVATIIFGAFNAPGWVLQSFIIVTVLGFPIAAVLAWAYELTPGGIQPTSRQMHDEGAVPFGRSKLDYFIIGVVLVAIAWLVYRTEFIAARQEAAESPLMKTAHTEAPGTGVLLNSIAVLPFDNLSPDPDNAYFAAGIHEEVLNQLVKIKDLAVIARTSVMPYADTDKPVPEIAAELNVGTVMEGSVRYAGDKVRITAQLIDARTGVHLWSEAYDRDLEDIFAIQSDIALNITNAMKVEFSLAERDAIGAFMSRNPAAYAHYVKARSLMQGYGPIQPAHAELDLAIALDPEFSVALATKSGLHAMAIMVPFADSFPTKESQPISAALATEFASRALAVNPNEAEAYIALSMVDAYYRRWDDAISNADRAYKLNPNHGVILSWQAETLGWQGEQEKAIPLLQQMIEIDPLNVAGHMRAVNRYRLYEEWGLMQATGRNIVALFPDASVGYLFSALAAAYQGNNDVALELASRAEALGWHPNDLALRILIYGVLGNTEEVSRLYSQFEEAGKAAGAIPSVLLEIYIVTGQFDRALDILDDAIDNNSSSIVAIEIGFYHQHPMFDPIRDNPRFQEVVNRAQKYVE